MGGAVKNLANTKAIEKIREIATDANICMFVTDLSTVPLAGTPMATQQVDDQGSIWFLSAKDSNRNRHINENDEVQLFYSNTSNYEYLSIYGTAEVIIDRGKAKELWTAIAKTWFEKGVDDPNLTLIKVTPLDAYYWDTKDNKMISLIKFAAGALGVKTEDGGVEGKLKV